MGRESQSGTERSRSGNWASLGFEEKLWAAADKMRGHMDATEYEHVALGLILPT
jgi:type I restriction enzyme M protein